MKNTPTTISFVAAAVLAAPLALGAETYAAGFLRQSIQGNLGEVELGKLALQKGARQDIRDFGATVAKEHADANVQALEAARSLGVAPPTGPGPKQKAVYKMLASLSGSGFDPEFVKAIVKDHQQDIARYGKAVEQADNAAGVYAKETLPHLHLHLQVAEQLEGPRREASVPEPPQ